MRVWITKDLDLVFKDDKSRTYHRIYYSRLRQLVRNKRYKITDGKLFRVKKFIVRSNYFPSDLRGWGCYRVYKFDVLYFSDIKKLLI